MLELFSASFHCTPDCMPHVSDMESEASPDHLGLLPHELVAIICLRLDVRSLARLEQCSTGLRRAVQVWL